MNEITLTGNYEVDCTFQLASGSLIGGLVAKKAKPKSPDPLAIGECCEPVRLEFHFD
jgi:hypothetical protein